MAGILDFYGYDSGANDIVSQKQQLLDNQAKIDGVQNEKIEELESRPCSGTVISVNGQTGNVILDADDVGAATAEQGMKADTAYQKPSSGIPTSDLASGVQTSLGKADTAIQEVKTINGNSIVGTGDINITSQTYVIDDTPTYDSNNLVKSGGVQKELALGAVWDVSEHNSLCGSTFESLSVILNSPNLDVLIPTSVRKGGMSIKFVQSSDNKYVEYFLTKDEWSASEADWEKLNLEAEISQIGQEVIDTVIPIDLSEYSQVYTTIQNGVWVASDKYYGVFIPVQPGEIYQVKHGTINGYYAVLKDSSHPGSGTPHWATGYSDRVVTTDATFTVPDDGAFIFWILKVSSGKVNATISKKHYGLVTKFDELSEDVNDISSEVDGISSDVDGIKVNIYGGEHIEEIDLSSLQHVSVYIKSDTGYWDSTTYYGGFFPVTPGQKVRITKGAISSYYAVLKDTNHVPSTYPNYATGYSGRVTVSGDTEFVVPGDANYVFVMLTVTAGVVDDTYKKVDTVSGLINDVEDLEDSMEEIAGDVEELDGDIDALATKKNLVANIVSLSDYPQSTLWINAATDEWNSGGSTRTILIPIYECYKLKIDMGISRTRIAFLKDNNESDSVNYSTEQPSSIIIEGGVYKYDVPSDASWLYVVVVNSSGVSVSPVISLFYKEKAVNEYPYDTDALQNATNCLGNTLRKLHYDLDEDGYQVPDAIQVLDIQRISKQATSIKWTPKLNIPKESGNFEPGVEVTGLPYSSVKELDKYIGKDVSIHTFMTAINNKYSLIYTERVSAAGRTSVWGKTYHGVNCSTYYGTVCTTFTGMCVGYKINYDSTEHKWLAEKIMKAVKLFEQSAQGLEIGDIVWLPGHCRLIVGLKRDSFGAVTYVQISEAIGSTCRQNADVSAESFNATLASESGIIYRPLEIYKNRYTPSPYVAVMGEEPQTVIYNDEICTFAGDMASFREGELVVLNYNLTDSPEHEWTHIEVYKDDVLLNTYALVDIDQSSLPESQRNHALSLGESLEFGKYKARMTDGENYSDYTYWEVLKTDIYASVKDGIAHITWNSSGKAVEAKICLNSGINKGHREFTESEVASNTADVDFARLNKEQYDGNVRGQYGVYLKVVFQGDYGRVTNEPLSIII